MLLTDANSCMVTSLLLFCSKYMNAAADQNNITVLVQITDPFHGCKGGIPVILNLWSNGVTTVYYESRSNTYLVTVTDITMYPVQSFFIDQPQQWLSTSNR